MTHFWHCETFSMNFFKTFFQGPARIIITAETDYDACGYFLRLQILFCLNAI